MADRALSNKFILLAGILMAALLAHSIYRDLILEKEYPGDLRNRVVGARLQKDGKLPYTFSNDTTGGIRYFDPCNQKVGGPGANNITASPFFHELLYPICDLPQRTLSRLWLLLQYIFLISMIGMSVTLTRGRQKQLIIICTGILFTATEAWIDLIANGQLYFFEAFLMSSIFFLVMTNRKYDFVFVGILSAMFVLVRPIGIVIFLPIVFYYRNYTVLLVTAFSGLLLYGLFVVISPSEKALYKNYITGMKLQIQLHQNFAPSKYIRPHIPEIMNIEGFDMNQVSEFTKAHPIKSYSESGNIFVLYWLLTNHTLSVKMLAASSMIVIVLLSFFFVYQIGSPAGPPGHLILFCFTLYMIAELFNPIHRHQYNTVQWFPMVLLALVLLDNRKNICFFLLVAGLLLNISNAGWLPLRHTIGEFCWLAALLILCFQTRLNKGPLRTKPVVMEKQQLPADQ